MTFYEELNKRIQERQPAPTKEDVGCGYLVFKKNTKFLDGVFFDPGDIGPTDGKPVGDFPLSLFFFAEKTVTAADDLIFFFSQGILQGAKKVGSVFTHITVFYDIHRSTFNHIQQMISFPSLSVP